MSKIKILKSKIENAIMPTYEYGCAKCGHEFEKTQSITDKPLRTCPKDLCGQKKWGRGKVKRLISTGGGLLFKGSGFYITDYRSEKYKAAAKKEAGAASPAGNDTKSPSAAGGDSKPAKPEVKPAKPTSAGS
jgi:putative FmdB family regulatory protein